MTDEQRTETHSLSNNIIDDPYLEIAREIAGGILQSRIGFGALRELRGNLWYACALSLVLSTSCLHKI